MARAAWVYRDQASLASRRQASGADPLLKWTSNVKLTYAHVKNFKSYRDSGPVQLGNKFTVFVGQNNSGKTAFLEALNPHSFRGAPHRTPQRTEFPPIPSPNSELEIGVRISGAELEHALKEEGGQYWIPVEPGNHQDRIPEIISSFFKTGLLSFPLFRTHQADWTAEYPSHQLFSSSTGPKPAWRIDITGDRQGWTVAGAGDGDSLPSFLGRRLARSYYGFRAERMNIGQCPINEARDLNPDASNLASVLIQLTSDPPAHQTYLHHVRDIFPNIHWVWARPINVNTAAIEIAMVDIDATGNRGPGITVPLSEAGTGVGQVLAILYVAISSKASRIIAIDEPNSFLHPGAAKKLITILKQFDHQYIISTHSADLVRVADPEYVHLVEWAKTESKFQTLNHKSIRDQRTLLADVGVSLSDVFGADYILWVEGPTEERCFPLLLEHLDLASPTLSIASVVATDDLTGNRPRVTLAWEVYQKLSDGSALLPPALAFALDREDRSAQDMDDLVRASRGKVKFLPRRTYENYLIDPEAITAVVTELMGSPPSQSAAEWIEQHKKDRKYLPRPLGEVDRWEVVVDAPKLLHDLFNAMSDAKVEYRKTTHSIMLTEWLLKIKPQHLSELITFVEALTATK